MKKLNQMILTILLALISTSGKAGTIANYRVVPLLPQEITLTQQKPFILNKEGNEPTVTSQNVQIKGGTANGVFYDIQTLRKSIPFKVAFLVLAHSSTCYQQAIEIPFYRQMIHSLRTGSK